MEAKRPGERMSSCPGSFDKSQHLGPLKTMQQQSVLPPMQTMSRFT